MAAATTATASARKTVLTDDGEIEIAVPRDRAGTFEPQLIPKGQTRFEGFDDRILSLYARGLTCARSKATSLSFTGSTSRRT